MENIFTPDLRRILMIFGISFLSLSFITGYIISKVRGAFKPFARNTVIYVLVFCILFSLTALCINLPIQSKFILFFIFQMIFLFLGIIHVNTIGKYNKWSSEENFWLNLLFTFVIALIGSVCFVIVYRICNQEGLDIYMATSALFFMFPLFVWETFLKAIAIPPKIFKLWYYPVHQAEEHVPDDSKMRNLLIISFEFKKKADDTYYTNFRAKAPVDMDTGELFYYFLNDYNFRHPKGKIEFINRKTGNPYGWIFYKKPKWYTIFTKYVNMDKTIFINSIKENDIIVCNRQEE